mmetsp:Transcript_48851/g.106184  ORF Transcript_48851/g.106184 Transcript_48851/m.106184 type:complete len:391 (-) Transcript_48851:350-1522(-)
MKGDSPFPLENTHGVVETGLKPSSVITEWGGIDAKTALNQFCQRVCHPITKQDIVYTVNKIDTQYQAIVKLNCIQGQEFAGELAATPKESEKAAAIQALKAHASVIASLDFPTAKKRRQPSTQAMPGMLGPVGIPGTLGASGALASPLLRTGAASSGEGHNPALTPKVKLNMTCMRIARRALRKGETIYEARQTVGGFQATVRLTCLPGEWADKVWAGEISSAKQAAEQSAAGFALEAILADEVLAAAATKTASRPSQKTGSTIRGPRGEEWQDKGKGKGYPFGVGAFPSKAMYWLGQAPALGNLSGPDLPRERITQEPIVGEIVEWKGSFGWIRPCEPIQHVSAARRSGRVYVHQQDTTELEAPVVGLRVQFQVYSDPAGLGADEVRAV